MQRKNDEQTDEDIEDELRSALKYLRHVAHSVSFRVTAFCIGVAHWLVKIERRLKVRK